MRLTELLGQLPPGLRDELLATFKDITANYRQERWEPSELNGGKFCEVVYTIVRGYADGAYAGQANKPRNMVDACRALEAEKHIPRSFSIQIPRMLIAMYEIRNNRGVGHVGGDVNPNHMDAVLVLYMSKWIIAELIRVFHSVDTASASAVVDSLMEQEIPVIWKVGTNRRVLARGITLKSQMLLLLYGEAGPVHESDLLAWLERSSTASTFRRDVLRPAHRDRLIEYNESAKTILLGPPGRRYVETNLPLTIAGTN